MIDATLTLTADEVVVVLQALRDYSDKLETALRHRRAWDKNIRRAQELNNNVLARVSDTYIEMDI